MRIRHFVLSMGLATFAMSGAAQANDVFDILTKTSATPPTQVPYIHMVDVIVSGSKGETVHEPLFATLRIDPSQSGGKRVTILDRSADARKEMNEALDEMIEEIEDPERTAAAQAQSFWCNTGGSGLNPDDFAIIDETDTHVTLRPNQDRMVSMFMQTGDRELDRKERSMARKLSDRLDGTLVYDKRTGQIESAEFYITQPMTVLLIAKIREMRMSQSCTLAPNGYPFVSAFSMDVRVTALGQKITNLMELSVRDLEPIRTEAAQTN